MLNDPSVRHSLPHRPHLLPVDAKRALVSLYADTTGVDLFGVRQLPEMVHWLQRAAMLHDDHEGRAIEAKEAQRLVDASRHNETAGV
ncbi:hypothetical protein [Hydrogenophaga atypica]|uniref:Uncharacterized protein n=1 Tax=Hydrogenophaga atypica TaxID=249409 RepID=A0ABW2QJ66_9BURK